MTTDIDWLQQDHQWPGLKAIGKITRTREAATKITVETACYLLSSPLSPERFGEVVRAHWGVGNRLHWVLDVVINEDQARNRLDNGPENLASSATWRSTSSPRKNPKSQNDESS